MLGLKQIHVSKRGPSCPFTCRFYLWSGHEKVVYQHIRWGAVPRPWPEYNGFLSTSPGNTLKKLHISAVTCMLVVARSFWCSLCYVILYLWFCCNLLSNPYHASNELMNANIKPVAYVAYIVLRRIPRFVKFLLLSTVTFTTYSVCFASLRLGQLYNSTENWW